MSYRITAVALWGLLLAAPGFAAEFEAEDPDDDKTEIRQEDEDLPVSKNPAAKAADAKKPTPVKPDPAKPEPIKVEPIKVEAKAAKPKDKDANDIEEYGPWQVKVPAEYRGNTFKLRIGDEVIDLSRDEITLKGSDFRERVDLIDVNGRLMSSDSVYVDPYIFDFVDSRTWRISLYFGGASVNGDAFRKLLQDNWLQENTIDFEYQPGPVGLMLTFANQHSDQDHSLGVTSSYEGSQARLAATFEWVPMGHGNGFFRKLHLLSYVGLLSADDRITIGDDTVEIVGESQSTGAIIGNDFMFPLWRFWLNVRVYASYHKIKFEDLDFEQPSVQRGILFGGSYAF